MTLRLLTTLILTLGTLVSTGCGTRHPDAPLPRPAPYSRLYLVDGQVTSIRAFRGKTTVVLFWASWCSYSTPALKELRKLANEVEYPDGVAFIAVSVDKQEAQEAVLSNIPESSSDLMYYAYSGNEMADEAYYQLKGGDLPHFLIIDPDGIIVASTHNLEDVKRYLSGRGLL